MAWVNILLEIIAVLLAIPVGYLIAYMASDELIQGRIWFRTLLTIGAILAVWFYLARIYYLSLTCVFIFIISFITYTKGFDEKWTKKRI